MKLVAFLHKIDNANIGKSYYNKQRGIQSKIKQICDKFKKESNINQIIVSFHVTSIYNSTLFEAFSKMVQEMMPQNRALSNLIEKLTNSCNFEKVFLFDVFNKIYLAMDSCPNASQDYELWRSK